MSGSATTPSPESRHHRDVAATASTTPTYSDLHGGAMEIGKQRQVCQGFRLNQGSNPHDLLLDDPWDLTLVSEPTLVSRPRLR